MTVKDFTKGSYTELKLQANKIKGSFVNELANLLEKSGIDVYNKYNINSSDASFGVKLEQAIMEFQEKHGLPVTGIVTDVVLDALYNIGKKFSDIIYSDDIEAVDAEEEESDNPHYESFFSEGNDKLLRRNKNNIVIELGNATITKTIHNVFMRSVSTEVDTSGNPIAEIYEFIAQDLTESDESNDHGKYL